MKNLTKISAVFAVVILAVSFAACRKTDITATFITEKDTWEYEDDLGTVEESSYAALKFHSDKTFVMTAVLESTDGDSSSEDLLKGTYTGKPASDGEIILTVTHIIGDSGEWITVPTEGINASDPVKVTVSNGSVTIDDLEFTRQ